MRKDRTSKSNKHKRHMFLTQALMTNSTKFQDFANDHQLKLIKINNNNNILSEIPQVGCGGKMYVNITITS